MFKILISLMVGSLISFILMFLLSMISKQSIMDREKMSPFECGFEPLSSSRMPFSLQFFLIAVLFLIFDIEIAIILPMVITLKFSLMKTWLITLLAFLLILIIGLYHEWYNGMLNWVS
uniref:NADH-ubiquinone oxidoreductase chain 3 n=1 Tax=Idiostolus sp. TaxID=2931296 RepID=A0A8U0A0T3_9HEMI|nr:NADH dehydrogenase subunit 3 [Idiostolus sp.]